ncbi:MAG: amidohydrolase family protein, partial [Pseudomonadota bacterium]
RGEIGSWMHDPTVIDYVEDRLARFKYKALGEFHAFGDDIETPVLQRMIVLARKHNLLLHAHSDADAVDRIFKTWPDARVLWAHSGFDTPDKVRETLRRHKNLWSDLAFRSEQASGEKVDSRWLAAFEEFPDRFMIGTDTFAPERWYYIKDHADYSRGWLSSLPEPLQKNIGYRNAERMLELLN